ncbi:MAG TPA: hypothetical protein VJ885_12870 [Thermoanaerobaculia bacterium]|nr:hypothetical protein [Thermoanaerobaculia bacterium]
MFNYKAGATKVFLIAALLLALNVPMAAAQPTTQPGLFFNIVNHCPTPVSGFAVGDELCLLQVGSATFTRAIFQGTMSPGQKQFGMACAGKDGNGTVIFVPPVGTAVQAVVVTVKPNEAVAIPPSFCGRGNEGPETLLQKRK